MHKITVMAFFALFTAACHSTDVPTVYTQRCQKCHGLPEDISKNIGPDLATSEYDFDQFKKQVALGSRWEGKPKQKYAFRHKIMPPQPHLSEEQMVDLFDYIQRSQVVAH